MKKKNIIIVFIVCILLSMTLFLFKMSNYNLKRLSADSGFDSSWDSGFDFGGSDWGGSDWDGFDFGGSDWGDSDWSSHNSTGDYSSDDDFFTILFFVFLIVIIMSVINDNKKIYKKKDESLIENENAIKNIMEEIKDFNKEEFYETAFDTFVNIQNAWTNFDYDKLRTLLTDELFNSYKTQLKTLELRKQINIMEYFNKDQIVIDGFTKSTKEYTFNVILRTRFYDYLTTQKGTVIKGSNKKRIIITYNLTFVRGISNKANKCPNCNAPLKNVASSVCPYCNSTIISDTHNLVLAKKEAINQRME